MKGKLFQAKTRFLVAALACTVTVASQAQAAVDDARIGAIVDSTAPAQYTLAEGTAACPTGQRAIGGGIVQSGPADDLTLRASGPLDQVGGSVADIRNGDKPRAWYAAATNEAPGSVSFRVFAVCATSKVKMRVKQFAMPAGQAAQRSVRCPRKQQAVGGGVLPGGGAGGSFVLENGPTDASGSFRKTRSGDAPRRWRAIMQNQGGSDYFKVLAVCAPPSTKAKLKVKRRKLSTTDAVRDALVPCPGGKRAVGGGVLHNRGLEGYFGVAPSGPLDAGGIPVDTTVGDVPKQWYGGLGNIFASSAKLKVAAICA